MFSLRVHVPSFPRSLSHPATAVKLAIPSLTAHFSHRTALRSSPKATQTQEGDIKPYNPKDDTPPLAASGATRAARQVGSSAAEVSNPKDGAIAGATGSISGTGEIDIGKQGKEGKKA